MEALPGANRPGSDPLQLLLLSSQVQKELGLSSTQIQQLQQINKQVRSSLASSTRSANPKADLENKTREAQSQVSEVLQPRQLARFREILYQVNAYDAAREQSASLGLTQEQQQKIANDRQATNNNLRGKFTNVARTRGASNPEASCNAVKTNRAALDSVWQQSGITRGILSSEQQASLDQLKGKTFALEAPPCAAPKAP